MAVRARRDAPTPYEQHRTYVLAVLRRRCRWLTSDECEVAFHDAYAVLLEKERSGELHPAAMHSQQLRAYLVQTALHKALDEGKRAWRSRSAPLDEAALSTPDGGDAPDELAAASWEKVRIQELVTELSERQQQIVKLRFFLDRKPEEIQQFMGITERVYRRELERALRLLSDRYELLRSGRFCESRRSMILAYVAGITGPTRTRQARDHLRSCPGCARWAADLREATRGAAVVIPLVPIVRDHGLFMRLLEALTTRGTAAGERVLTLNGRIDPGAAVWGSGARPGAVVVAVSGCLAMGGTATYCAVNGVPEPVRRLVGAADQAKPAKPPARPPVAGSAGIEDPPAVPARSAPSAQSPRSAGRRRTKAAESRERERGPVGARGTPRAEDTNELVRAPTAAPTPTTPRRSPPPGEFDP